MCILPFIVVIQAILDHAGLVPRGVGTKAIHDLPARLLVGKTEASALAAPRILAFRKEDSTPAASRAESDSIGIIAVGSFDE